VDLTADLLPRIAELCLDPNPRDNRIRCQLPDGHEGRHHAEYTLGWDNSYHWPGDDCDPCTNPNRSPA
jgi:hypothetical protein